MKTMFKKYKMSLIGGGILLSIIVLSFIINLADLKQNIDKNKVELGAISETSILDGQTEADNQTKENKIIEIQDEEDKNIYQDKKGTGHEVGSANKEHKGTYASENNKAKVEKEVETTQVKENHKNSPPNITGEKYTVKKGDTLFLIAQRSNIPVNHLMEINNLYSDIIYENQILKIQNTKSNPPSQVAVSRGGERSEDLYWLSRIIHSEAQGESYAGKVAVGNVIINRVNSGLFPNTVKGVVFDKQNGYTQFSPVIDGTIYNTPGAESVRAANEVLDGARPVGNSLYFLNPRKSTNFWIVNNRKYMQTIGLHDFYY